jgi:hypothetical protein
MADYGCYDNVPWHVTPTKKVVGFSAEMDIVIETRLFNLFDQVRPR